MRFQGNSFTIEGKEYDFRTITFRELRHMYETGRVFHISGSGRDKKTGYRVGVQTKIGDIEKDEWISLVRRLIAREGEEGLFAALLKWVTENVLWERTEEGREYYTLQLYSSRIFEDEKWVGYPDFHRKYLPNFKAPVNQQNRKDGAHERERKNKP